MIYILLYKYKLNHYIITKLKKHQNSCQCKTLNVYPNVCAYRILKFLSYIALCKWQRPCSLKIDNYQLTQEPFYIGDLYLKDMRVYVCVGVCAETARYKNFALLCVSTLYFVGLCQQPRDLSLSFSFCEVDSR